ASSEHASPPAWVKFVRDFDADFRRRRLAFLIQAQNRLYAMLSDDEHGDERLQIDSLNRALYAFLERLRRFEEPTRFSRALAAELRALLPEGLASTQPETLELDAEAFVDHHDAKITRAVERLAAELDLGSVTDELDRLLAGMDTE